MYEGECQCHDGRSHLDPSSRLWGGDGIGGVDGLTDRLGTPLSTFLGSEVSPPGSQLRVETGKIDSVESGQSEVRTKEVALYLSLRRGRTARTLRTLVRISRTVIG